jgi:hypothetical protein
MEVRMKSTMAARIRALQEMTVPELRAKYREVFGEETRSRHKEFLWKQIAWRLQALEEGDLSERARRRAGEIANDADVRVRKVAGARRECPECGALAKAVLLDGRQAAPDDILVRGAGSPGAVEKERDVGFRVASVYAANGGTSAGELDELLGRAGLSAAAVKETERGRWAGTVPECPIVAPLGGGAFVVLEEIAEEK